MTRTGLSFSYETYIRATPDRVWQAFTDGDLTAQWSPNSWAIRPAQPPMPNCWTARLIAVATMPAVGASEGCSPEQNRAGQRAPVRSSWVRVICVAVDIA